MPADKTYTYIIYIINYTSKGAELSESGWGKTRFVPAPDRLTLCVYRPVSVREHRGARASNCLSTFVCLGRERERERECVCV